MCSTNNLVAYFEPTTILPIFHVAFSVLPMFIRQKSQIFDVFLLNIHFMLAEALYHTNTALGSSKG